VFSGDRKAWNGFLLLRREATVEWILVAQERAQYRISRSID
jgi:hypothetical protein